MTWPEHNRDWWRNKIVRTRDRDRETDGFLAEAGWQVVRVWEHEPVGVAAERVRAAVSAVETESA